MKRFNTIAIKRAVRTDADIKVYMNQKGIRTKSEWTRRTGSYVGHQKVHRYSSTGSQQLILSHSSGDWFPKTDLLLDVHNIEAAPASHPQLLMGIALAEGLGIRQLRRAAWTLSPAAR